MADVLGSGGLVGYGRVEVAAFVFGAAGRSAHLCLSARCSAAFGAPGDGLVPLCRTTGSGLVSVVDTPSGRFRRSLSAQGLGALLCASCIDEARRLAEGPLCVHGRFGAWCRCCATGRVDQLRGLMSILAALRARIDYLAGFCVDDPSLASVRRLPRADEVVMELRRCVQGGWSVETLARGLGWRERVVAALVEQSS